MLRYLIRGVALLVTLAAIVVVASPAHTAEIIGMDLGLPADASRVVAAFVAVLSFILFSLLRQGSVEVVPETPPDVPVGALIERVVAERPELAKQAGDEKTLSTILQFLTVQRKIAAVKAARPVAGGLKESKELVEAIWSAAQAHPSDIRKVR